jgi:predicted MPP superfamily phosphohydrolase
VLTHTPPVARKLPEGEGLVCLSGHTHGGHFVIPGVTPLALRVGGQPFVRGRYDVNGNVLYVNRGLGAVKALVPRVGAEPEVTVLTLRA